MKIFNRNPTYTKHYLRIYCNIGKSEYSETEKEQITNCFMQLPMLLFETINLKFDISGIGYGISKGGPLIGEKALRRKFEKKGFSKMDGFVAQSKQENYNSGFTTMIYQESNRYLDCYFSWPFSIPDPYIFVEQIVIQLLKVVKINYGYCYPTDDNHFDLGEGIIKNGLFSTTLSQPESEIKWSKNIYEITMGMIKKLYPINILNTTQIERLKTIEAVKEQELNRELKLWILDNDVARTQSIENAVLK